MAAEDERELDALLSELRATEAAPRDDSSERARRARISRAIERQAKTHAPRPIHNTSGGRGSAWALAGAAAALILGIAVVSWLRNGDTATVEPEPIQNAEGARSSEPPPMKAANNELPVPLQSPAGTEARPARRLAAPSASPSASSAVPAAASGESPSVVAPAAEASSASLAVQNELFQSAVRAARRGDDEGALRQFDSLLERFPQSPLAADSLVRKFRTLARLKRAAESAAAAREYLERYPQGFAAAEAEKIASSTVSDGDARSP